MRIPEFALLQVPTNCSTEYEKNDQNFFIFVGFSGSSGSALRRRNLHRHHHQRHGLGLFARDEIAPIAQDVAHVAVVPDAQLQR